MFQADKEIAVTETTKHPCLPVWRKRIAEALERGHFTERDRVDAGSWDCCAVGEANAQGFKVYCKDGKIRDPLFLLGVRFCTAVGSNNLYYAGSALSEIENALAKF